MAAPDCRGGVCGFAPAHGMPRGGVWAHPDDQLVRHLADFVAAYNFARRLKTLNGLSPYEFVRKRATSERERPFATIETWVPSVGFRPLELFLVISTQAYRIQDLNSYSCVSTEICYFDRLVPGGTPHGKRKSLEIKEDRRCFGLNRQPLKGYDPAQAVQWRLLRPANIRASAAPH